MSLRIGGGLGRRFDTVSEGAGPDGPAFFVSLIRVTLTETSPSDVLKNYSYLTNYSSYWCQTGSTSTSIEKAIGNAGCLFTFSLFTRIPRIPEQSM